jgi:hypothetical protein
MLTKLNSGYNLLFKEYKGFFRFNKILFLEVHYCIFKRNA